MRLAKSYTSFHAIRHGEQDGGETVGCRWHQRSNLLVSPNLPQSILDTITTKHRSSYVARRFFGSGNTVGPVELAAEHFSLFIHCFRIVFELKHFETHAPSHVSYDVYNDVACCCCCDIVLLLNIIVF